MHSSLHTIRPMANRPGVDEDMVEVPPPSKLTSPSDYSNLLQFPFRENTIARRARSPGQNELAYQFAEAARRRKASLEYRDLSPTALDKRGAIPPARQQGEAVVVSTGIEHVMEGNEDLAKRIVHERLGHEAEIGQLEAAEEIGKTGVQSPEMERQLERVLSGSSMGSELNAEAASADESEGEMMEESMEGNVQGKKRVRREKLSQKLMEVFGLDEREEVVEEMKCWLLRSISESIPIPSGIDLRD